MKTEEICRIDDGWKIVEKMGPKLVRDNVPEIMLSQGKTVEMRMANGREYEFMLWRKLQEEVDEFMRERNAEEIADIQEVLHCIAELRGIAWERVEEIREKKKQEKGGFRKKIILQKVENFPEKFYQNDER